MKTIVKHCPHLVNLVLANCPLITDVAMSEIATNLSAVRYVVVCSILCTYVKSNPPSARVGDNKGYTLMLDIPRYPPHFGFTESWRFLWGLSSIFLSILTMDIKSSAAKSLGTRLVQLGFAS